MMQPGDALYIPPFWSRASVVLRGPSHRINSQAIPTNYITSSSPASNSCRGLANVNQRYMITNGGTPPSSSGGSDQEVHPLDITIKVSFRNLPHCALTTSQCETWSSELKAYEDGRRDLERVVKRFTSGLGLSNGVTAVPECPLDPEMLLDHVPKDVAKAYLQRLGKELLMKAEEL